MRSRGKRHEDAKRRLTLDCALRPGEKSNHKTPEERRIPRVAAMILRPRYHPEIPESDGAEEQQGPSELKFGEELNSPARTGTADQGILARSVDVGAT